MATEFTVAAIVLFVLAVPTSVNSQTCENTDAEVLILGAGLAGITAAKTLHDSGITNFRILEQAGQIGGRVRSVEFAGVTVELGTQWIIANPSDTDDPFNIIHGLALECGLDIRNDTVGSRGFVAYDQNGVNITDEYLPPRLRLFRALGGANQLANQLNEEDPDENVDISIEVGLRLNGWIPRTPIEQTIEWTIFDLGLGQPTDSTSFRRVFAMPGGQAHLVTDQRGLVYLLQCLAENVLSPTDSRLHLNTRVTSVQWSDECVCATAVEDGESRQYCAPYAIHTFSIGSLQFGTVQFEPELPPTKLFAINQLNQANLLGIFIAFNNTFWDDDIDSIRYVDSVFGREYYPSFYPVGASLPGQPPILQAFLTGETALRVAQQDLEITKQQIVEILQRIYGDRVTEPTDIVHHEFITNPHFFGALTTPLVGATTQTHETVAAPLGRLYFGGDAREPIYSRWLQGAYFSGLAVANEIMQDIQEGLPLGAQFTNNSPRVVGNTVEASFTTTGPVASVFCSLSGGNQDRQECSSGTVAFTDVVPGSHVLRVIVHSSSRERVVERGRVTVPAE